MQRNVINVPNIIFSGNASKMADKGNHPYFKVTFNNSLAIIYVDNFPYGQLVQLDNIPDKDNVLTELSRMKIRNTLALPQDARKKIIELLENYHQSLLSTTACADVIVNIFKEFYDLNEVTESLIHNTAYVCLECASKTLGELHHKIPNAVAELFFEYLRRYLAATAGNSRNFLSILDFQIINPYVNVPISAHQPFAQSDSDASSSLIETDFTDDDDKPDHLSSTAAASSPSTTVNAITSSFFAPTTLELVNESMLMDLARYNRSKEFACDDTHVRQGLKCVLEKIMLPAIILACKISFDQNYWNGDFLEKFSDRMEIKTPFKYNMASKGITKSILGILSILERHFLNTIGFNVHVKLSQIAVDRFTIKSTAYSTNSSQRFFHQTEPPKAPLQSSNKLRHST